MQILKRTFNQFFSIFILDVKNLHIFLYTFCVYFNRGCGTAIPPHITTLHDAMTVTFTSDSSVTYTGFRAMYTVSECELRHFLVSSIRHFKL